MGYKTNGVDTGGLPIHLVKPLIENYQIPFFVETGTASGDSARWAEKNFAHVWTMELIEGRQGKEASSNINWLIGDSTELLPTVIEELLHIETYGKKPWVLFYLDAHYSDTKENETGYPECPVLKEIEIIADNYGYESIIIIDDARLFLGQPPHPHNPEEWPSVLEIFMLLKEKFPYHHITITDDYLLAIPLHVRDVIDKEWRDRFHVRYPNESDKLKGQVKDVYNALLKYIQ
jgi:hypothetical protein